MATRKLTSDNGRNRLIISTILTHLIAFDEAGMEFATERKQIIPIKWWDPSTWSGFKWVRSDNAIQPSITDFAFIQTGTLTRRDPNDFAVTEVRSRGYLKTTCFQAGIHIDSGGVGPGDGRPNTDTFTLPIAKNVSDVEIRFTYDGVNKTLRHSSG